MNRISHKIANLFSKKYYLLPSLYGRGLGVGLLLGAWLGSYAQTALYPDAFPLGDITLLDGPLKHARDLNVNVMLTVSWLLTARRLVFLKRQRDSLTGTVLTAT